MAIPLKTGADLYNNELLRARLHNHPADALDEYGVGSFYFNNSSGLNSSDRMRYRGLTAWHSVANLEDIEDVKDLIKALSGSSSESVASVLGRVITLEGYFSNGKAKDADLLDGHNSDYFATASGLNALQEKVSAFLDGEADSDAVLENLKEIQAFLDSYDGATSLADMFGAVNTQIADRYTKAEADARYLKLTGGKISGGDAPLSINSNSLEVGLHFTHKDESKVYVGWRSAHGAYIYNSTSKSYLGISDDGTPQYNLYELLHLNNYSDLITDLNKNLNVPSITIGGIKLSVVEGQLQIEGDAYATGQLSSGGIGSEGSGSGASGIVILEDWEKYDDTLAQVLGAGLGVGLRDKIAALESKATNVSVAQTLTSGKEIGAITIDGVATKLFAPNDYISTSGGTLTGDLYFQDSFIRLDMGKTGKSRISNIYGDEEVNALAFTLTGLYLKSPRLVYVDTTGTNYDLLHSGNFKSYAPTLTGTGASGTWGIDISGSADSFNLHHASPNKASVDRFFTGGFQSSGTPKTNYATGFTLRNFELAWDFQLSFDSDARLYTRRRTSSDWQDWKTVAFTDSVVAGANKLVTTSGTEVALAENGGVVFPYTQSTLIDGLDSVGLHVKRNMANNLAASGGIAITNVENKGTILFGSASGLLVYNYVNNAYSNVFRINNHGNVTIGSSDLASTNWKLYVDGFLGVKYGNGIWSYLADGTTYAQILGISGSVFSVGSQALVNNSIETRLVGSKISLYTSANLSVLVNSSGNVTIGGGSDQAGNTYKLRVWGKANIGTYNDSGEYTLAVGAKGQATVRLFDGSDTNGAQGAIIFGQTNGFKIGSESSSWAGIQDLVFFGSNNTTSPYTPIWNEVLRVTYDGKVGIGTNSPKAKLHVNGTILAKENVMTLGTYGGYSLYGGIRDDEAFSLETTNSEASWQAWAMRVTLSGAVSFNHSVSVRTRLLVGGATDDGVSTLQVNGPSKLGGILTLPINHQIQWGDSGSMIYASANAMDLIAPIAYFSKDVHVRGNLIVDGQVSSGGVAEAGTGGVGGSALDRLVFEIPANTTSFPCEHGLGTRDISVTIYEKGNDFQQVLADVYLDSTNVARIVFGSATDVAHKVVIIG